MISKALSEYKQCLAKLFVPKEIHPSVFEIDTMALYNRGYKTILLDVDNTILPTGVKDVTMEYQNWIDAAKRIGFNVFLVSNNSSHRRIDRAAIQVDTRGCFFAMKPLPFSTIHLSKKFHFELSKTIVVGDQVLTDVLLGNWIKGYPILVDPMNKKLSFIKTLQREIDLFLLSKLK